MGEDILDATAGTQEWPPKLTHQATERRRVQELLRYFQPSTPATEAGKQPRVAFDIALTAYAQLCALKLNCQRSFISLMDNDTQYIIAEATRTVSLESAEVHDGEDDALYLGSTTLDLLWGVCPNTIKFFTSNDHSLNVYTPYIKANHHHYVMNDLSKIPGFATRPYVAGWPHMRYYAEVPIHSPAGYTIGTLCVVDNNPREGLDTKGLTVLREIAVTIMNHLDLVVSKAQRNRAERMINGLGLFVGGNDKKGQWWIDSIQDPSDQKPDSEKASINDGADRVEPMGSSKGSSTFSDDSTRAVETDESEEDYFGAQDLTAELPQKPFENTDEGASKDRMRPIPGSVKETLDFERNGMLASIAPTRFTSGRFSNTLPNQFVDKYGTVPHFPRGNPANLRTSFQKKPAFATELDETLGWAAKLIRESIDLDGVIFLDSHSGSSTSNKTDVLLNATSRDMSQLVVPSEHSDHHDRWRPNSTTSLNGPEGDVRRLCRILASSTISDDSVSSYDIYELTLQRIVHRFPRGGILNFGNNGILLTHSELEYTREDRPSNSRGQSSPNLFRTSASTPDGGAVMDAQWLHRLIPTASSIILFPIRNTVSNKPFAYNIAWTADETRVFQREDFVYLSSFSNLIMAELSRLDTVAADRAKADFISSISHELRSPLHGILASAELLRDLTNEPGSSDIITTIQACGSTLLDTMNNLLAFSKINNFTKTREEKTTSTEVTPGLVTNPHNLSSDVDLSTLVEEVMHASIAGHQFHDQFSNGLAFDTANSNQTPSPLSNSNCPQDLVTVICNIQPLSNWMFQTEPGAWKRILMNLVGNALKYTKAGFIYVRLRQEVPNPSADGAEETRIFLSVEDSGKGISEGYLRSRLFKPFQQENPLQPGTGLGLSIVHQLVNSLNGSIKVISEVGSGTKIEITVPLKGPADLGVGRSMPVDKDTYGQLNGRKLGFVGLDTRSDIEQTSTSKLSRDAKLKLGMILSITNAAKNLGVDIVSVHSFYSEAADILVTTESHFRSAGLANLELRKTPVIVLCSNLILDYRPMLDDGGPVLYLSQPYGPQRFAKALTICLPYCIQTTQTNGTHASTAPALPKHDRSIECKIPSPVISTTPPTHLILRDLDYNRSEKHKKRPRALLVEDNSINLKLLVTFMKRLACPYVTATDGLQAVQKYKENMGEFDVIFMDMQMPAMDGFQASYEIRKHELQASWSRTKIIALTGLASAEAQEQALRSGVDMFLTKPVPMKVLKTVIEGLAEFQVPAG